MKKYKLTLILSIFVLISCEKKYVLNTILLYNNQIVTENDTTNIKFEKIVNGEFSYKLNNLIIKKGTIENSLNIGTWKYVLINENQKIDTSFIWNVIQKNNYKISYPTTWRLIKEIDSSRLFIFDLSPNIERKVIDNQFLVVLKHQKERNTLKGYNNYHNNRINENYEVIRSNSFKIVLDGKIIGYFNRFSINSSNYILNYNFETTESVFDISLKTNSIDNQSIYQLLFFEFIRNFSINENQVLSRKGILKIELIE